MSSPLALKIWKTRQQRGLLRNFRASLKNTLVFIWTILLYEVLLGFCYLKDDKNLWWVEIKRATR